MSGSKSGSDGFSATNSETISKTINVTSLLTRYACCRLRDEGYVVVIPGYRRYPEGSVGEQAQDVGEVLNWVEENVAKYGGDSGEVKIVGHSSGAHIAALHLLTTRGDCRVGAFVGMCGVYDIVEHYKWEKSRGVHEISALKPANGFVTEKFAESSPVLLARGMSEEEVRACKS